MTVKLNQYLSDSLSKMGGYAIDPTLNSTLHSYCSNTCQALHSHTVNMQFTIIIGRFASKNSKLFLKQWAFDFTQK